MRRAVLVLLCLALLPVAGVRAAEAPAVPMRDPDVDLGDRASLQRGARLFVNYCLSCHSLQYMRFNRMGRDLGLSEEQVEQNLMFTEGRVLDTMSVAMNPDAAARWFGAPTPDLSVTARSRGAEWIYNYLLTFYKVDDPTRPTGVDNLVFKGSSMPHALWELQGIQVPVYEEVEDSEGEGHREIVGLELAEPGVLNPAEYRRAAQDITNFLVYAGEPAKMLRYDIGLWVLVFLIILFALTYALYKEYWKDVH